MEAEQVYKIWGWSLVSISLLFGVICIINVHAFYTQRESRFIQIRKPRLILLYCICGSLPTLIITSPLKAIFDISYSLDSNDKTSEETFKFIWWLLTFLQELVVSSMTIVIVLRCWLLYYDHQYEISIVDKNWRGVINPTTTDFWLKNRKTWGDTGFLTGFGFLLFNCVLIIFSVISISSLQTSNLTSLNAVSLFAITIPCYIFIASLILYGKQKKLFIVSTDKFKIIAELQYLSLSTLLMIIIYIIQLCDIKQLVLLIETGQILFAFITNFIQTRWVLQQFKKHKRDMFLSEIGEKSERNNKKTKNKNNKNNNNNNDLEMIDVLRNKYGFGMFMRYCQNELNVEGLLFIIEVAQYKAKLVEDEQVQSILSQSTTPSTDITASGSPSSPSSTSSTDKKRKKSDCKKQNQILPSLNKVRKDDVKRQAFEKFQGNVLTRDWMPIANQLFAPKDKKRKKSGHHHNHHNKHKNNYLKEIEVTKTAMKELAIDLNAEYDENGDPIIMDDTKEGDNEKEDEIDIEWMFQYAQYLFLKYIDVESEFSINVSYLAKQDLLLFFSKEMEKGFEFILNKHGISTTVLNQNENTEKEVEYLIKIKDYLVHIFDIAVSEVWSLLAKDTFLRFMQTEQYKYLADKYKKSQLRLV